MSPSTSSTILPPKDGLVRARPGLEVRAASDDEMPRLVGYILRFNEPTEIDSVFEGRFIEEIAPGAAAKTLEENRLMRVIFNHGMDPNIGEKPLAEPLFLEDRNGVRYDEPQLLDAEYVRELLPGLRAGQYGSSFKFRVVQEEFDERPKRSESNPDGLPVRRITELKLYEGGPVVFPAYAGATTGVRMRSTTDRVFFEQLRRDPSRMPELGDLFGEWVRTNPERAADLITKASSGTNSGSKEPNDDLQAAPWAMLPELLPMVAAMAHGERSAFAGVSTVLSGVFGAEERDAPTASGIAVIQLRGVITPRGMFSGGGLETFREQLHQAVASEDVGAIVLDIDSPGGRSDLVAEAAADIRKAREEKTVVAIANARAASAAYWLASQASEVVVTPSGEVGSIGVFSIHEDYSGMDAQMGVKTTLISAGKYKTEGNPYEPLSDEARAAIQAKVDEVYEAFIADVAKGRGVTPKEVREDFGEGRMVGPKDAVKAGMADRSESRESALARLTNLRGRSTGPMQDTEVADAGRSNALPGAEGSHSGGSRDQFVNDDLPPWREGERRTPPWCSQED